MQTLTRCDLTPEQEQQWESTMSLMMWTAPGFRHLFYKLLNNNNGKHVAVFTKDIPTACTDAVNIFYNPDWFFGLKLKERVFVTAHEIMHNCLQDVPFLHRCQTSGVVPGADGKDRPFRMDIMQKAMDLRINPILVDSKIGTMPHGGLIDTDNFPTNTALLEVYGKLYEDAPDGGGGGGQGQGDDGQGNNPNPGGFDHVAAPGSMSGKTAAQAQPNPQQWAIEMSAARKLEEMRSQGKMPGAMQRFFEELLNPKVPWQDMIRTSVMRVIGNGGYNWRKPNRRFIGRDLYLPSPTGYGCNWLVAWGDTSGSMSKEDMAKYFAEIGGIVEDVKPKRFSIAWCDASIDRVDEITDLTDIFDVKAKGVGGGGGTDCGPVFEWIAEQMEVPDMFIGFTDGHVDFPDRQPSFPVIWASVGKQPDEYPWGDVVMVD